MNCKVIAIYISKGGCGKTTSTIEIAACLSELGKKVLVIDMDPQCDATRNAGAEIKNTIKEVIDGKIKIKDSIQKCSYFDFISGSTELLNADKEYTDRDDVYLLDDICSMIKEEYDFILTDNPPARNMLANMTYVASDYIIVPTLADENSVVGISSVESDLRKYRESRNKESHAVIIGLILTRFKANTVQHQIILEQLQEFADTFNYRAFVETVREAIAVAEVKSIHKPLIEYDSKNNATEDYRRISKKLLEVIGE